MNGGKYVKSNDASWGSQTAVKMHRYDNKRKYWMFSWCSIGNKSLAERYEKLLQESEEPIFNNISMGGK